VHDAVFVNSKPTAEPTLTHPLRWAVVVESPTGRES